MRKSFSRVKSEEWLAFIFILVFFSISVVAYGYEFSVRKSFYLMAQYFTFGEPMYGLFFAFIWIFFFGRLYFFLINLLKRKIFNRQPFKREDIKQFVYFCGSHFRVLIPLILVPLAAYQFIAVISYHLRFSALDPMFFGWDEKIFGGQAFIFLPSVFKNQTMTLLFSNAYSILPIMISLTMIVLYLKSPDNMFRKMLAAYVISIFIAMPFFYSFPCQDPNNYFLKNIRGRSFPTKVYAQLNQYSPNQLTKEVTQKISDSETHNEADNAVPVSCFPSMHAAWSLLVIFFLASVWRPSLFLTVPWTLLLLTGGLYFAQHYAVDYLMAVPVVLASILLGGILIRPKKSSELASL